VITAAEALSAHALHSTLQAAPIAVRDSAAKPPQPPRHYVSPKGCSNCPTAWAYISSQPSLTAVAGMLKTVGLDTARSGLFGSTLVLPTNEVWPVSLDRGAYSCCSLAIQKYAETEVVHQGSCARQS
jgi:hypothetical protein